MKTFTIAAVLASAVALVSAQNIPTCVSTCYSSNLGSASGCTGLTDIACLCRSAPFLQAVGHCFSTSCNAADAAAGIAFGQQSCAAVGVSVSATSVPTQSASGSSEASSLSSVASSASSAGSSAGSAVSSVLSSASSARSSALSSISSRASSGIASTLPSASAAPSTGDATNKQVGMVALAGVVGAAAFLAL